MKEYYYLVSSLPMLEFGMKMPFPYSDFLKTCQEQLSTHDMETIKSASSSRGWKIFDTTLRNELARARASKREKDPTRYIRGEYSDPYIAGPVQKIINQDSLIEAEMTLDRMRWEKIEELEKGHYFDISYLITYALKLQLLERWEQINSEGGIEILEGLLEKETA